MMKILLIFLALMPRMLLAQDTTAVKHANRIIVVTGRPAKENYQLLLLALKDNGYTLSAINNDSLTVYTGEKQGMSVNMTYHIKGHAKDKEIILSGQYRSKVVSSLSGTEYRIFVYDISKGKKGSAAAYCFEAMNSLAKNLNGKIYYKAERTKKKSVF